VQAPRIGAESGTACAGPPHPIPAGPRRKRRWGVVRAGPSGACPRGACNGGTAVDQLGVVAFEHDAWSHPTVAGLLDATIAHEEAALAASPTTPFGLGDLPALSI
jgi:hypothetical protein